MKTTFSIKKNICGLAEFFLLLYVAENAVGSSGHLVSFGPVSLRMLLFAACFLLTIYFVFVQRRDVLKDQRIVLIVLFAIWLLFCTLLGINFKNQTNFIWSDLSSFLGLALFPGFIVILESQRNIKKLIEVVFWSALVLSVITIGIHLCIPIGGEEVICSINTFLNSKSLGGLALLNSGMHRVYMRSQIFIQVAIIYGVWLIYNRNGKSRISILICEGIMLFALLLTYTRGFWLGFLVSSILLLLLEFKNWNKLLAIAGIALCVMGIFVGISTWVYNSPCVLTEAVSRISPDLLANHEVNNNVENVGTIGNEESTDLITDEAAGNTNKENLPEVSINQSAEEMTMTDIANLSALEIRSKTLEGLKERISDHPIIGNGLGSNLTEIREDGRTEYMYLDILLKTGIIGLILFLLVFFRSPIMLLIKCLKEKNEISKKDKLCAEVLVSSYIGVAVTSIFNPFLNNPMGITLLMITSTGLILFKRSATK